jgi:transcriptional regulator with XRE-family HTH domain
MPLTTGNQLKAARALAGVDQQQVADSAGVNVNTIRNMEARGPKPITSGAVTVHNVQVALEALGIEFLNHMRPGVRLSVSSARAVEVLGAKKHQGASKAADRTSTKATRKKRYLRT